MKYKCIPCNHEFEAKSDTKPRCPRCLKIHDVEPIEEAENSAKGGAKSLLVPALVLIVAGIVAATYFFVKKKDTEPPAEPAVNPQTVLEKAGIPDNEVRDPCAPKASVKTLATKLSGGKEGTDGMNALFEGITGLKERGLWLPHNQREPGDSRPLTAATFAERLTKGNGGPWHATSYELACLLYASAKALDIEANMVEIHRFKGEKKPADAEGKFGRYGVTLAGTANAKSEQPVYDLYGGRTGSGALATVTVLNDGGVIAPYFGLSALSLLVKQNMSKALSLNDIAIKLDDQNPYFRSTRGFIFAATGVPSESLVEFEKALKLRSDPIRRINLAEILMLINPLDKRAETEVQAALKDAPDFARAHALKGMIHLVRQEKDQAETELALAERLDPKSPSIAMYWARYYSVTMQSEEAVAKAMDAVKLSGESVSMLLGLAGIYREVARFEDMRRTLDKIYTKLDTPQMADQIKQVFGYDPSPDAEETESDTGGVASKKEDLSPASDFKLKLGDSLNADKKPGLGGNLNLDLNIQ